MNNKYKEDNLENATLEWLKDIGYSVVFGPDIAFDDILLFLVLILLLMGYPQKEKKKQDIQILSLKEG